MPLKGIAFGMGGGGNVPLFCCAIIVCISVAESGRLLMLISSNKPE